MTPRPKLLWDSSLAPFEAPDGAEASDVATDFEAAASLARLGLTRADLPALLVADAFGKLRLLGTKLSADEAAALADGRGVEAATLTVYSAGWCPDCRIAKRVLADAGAAYEEVDIDRDDASAELVMARSGGRRVIPTLVWDGRIWAFNLPPPALRRLLNGARAAP